MGSLRLWGGHTRTLGFIFGLSIRSSLGRGKCSPFFLSLVAVWGCLGILPPLGCVFVVLFLSSWQVRQSSSRKQENENYKRNERYERHLAETSTKPQDFHEKTKKVYDVSGSMMQKQRDVLKKRVGLILRIPGFSI